ncbi:MAG: hypothetical protein WCE61_07235 [Candidatus Acidiferrum sp.]
MLRHARLPSTRLYAVEISGWDSLQSFFVEKCDLIWNEDSDKHVVLKRALRKNTTLFVRLLQSGEAGRSHPVVYEAELVGRAANGLLRFRLTAAAPRLREAENSVV